jgi:hypothetical protein
MKNCNYALAIPTWLDTLACETERHAMIRK